MDNRFIEYIKDNKRLVLLIGVIILIVGLIVKILFSFLGSVNNTYEPIKDSKPDTEDVKDVKKTNNLNVLLIGKDKESKEGSVRTDTIMLLSYNEKSNNIKMTRIPRDLYVSTDGYEGKINGLYESKGLSVLKSTISDYFGVPITNYVETDFDGLTKIVDSMGGIEVNSNIKIDETNNKEVGSDIFVSKGDVNLNGEQALAYSRIRKIDNDIERGKRQEQVINAMLDKLSSPSQVMNAEKNVETISDYVSTDVTASQIVDLIPKAIKGPSIEPLNFEWSDIEDTSYVKLTEQSRKEISDTLRKQLDVDNLDSMETLKLEPTSTD